MTKNGKKTLEDGLTGNRAAKTELEKAIATLAY